MYSTLSKKSMSESLQPRKKRQRSTKSCVTCRRQKTRCDQVRPACGTCTRRGKAHMCEYERNWKIEVVNSGAATGNPSSTVDLNKSKSGQGKGHKNIGNSPPHDKLEEMSGRIRQLEEQLWNQRGKPTSGTYGNVKPLSPIVNTSLNNNEDQPIDFYNNLFPSPINYSQGPLSWVSLLRKDIYLNSMVKLPRVPFFLDHQKTQPKSKAHKEFLKRWQVEDVGTSTMTPGTTKAKKKNVLTAIKTFLEKDPRLIWLLVDKYFESEFFIVYALIDKDDFLQTLCEIMGERSDTIIKLKVLKRYQLSILGILLLIMRMASLTMYNYGKKPFFPNGPTKGDQYIMDHPISVDIMKIIDQIHDELKSFKEPRLEIFQFLSMRIYFRFVSPEDCDCVSVAMSGPVGYLLQYGIQCGLNRDPTSSTVGPLAPLDKNRNLLRRLWYKVVYLDSHQLLLVGSPPVIDSKFYDTHFPHIDECQNEMDYISNVWFYDRAKLYDICHPLLMRILNIREKPTVAEVKRLLVPLVDYIATLPTLDEIMKKPYERVVDRIRKLQDLAFLLDCSSLQYIVYYHLFLFYNERMDKEQSLHYLLELINIATKLYPIIMFLEPTNTEYDLKKHFGQGILLFPKIEHTLHRISEFLFAIIARVKGLKLIKDGLDPKTISLLDNTFSICNSITSYVVQRFMNISDTYYHPWVVSKVHALILVNLLSVPIGAYDKSQITQTDSVFIENLNNCKRYDSMFETYQYEDLLKINNALTKFQEIEKGSAGDNSYATQWTSQSVNAIEQRWFEQMFQSAHNENIEINGSSNISPNSFTDTTTAPTDPDIAHPCPYTMPSNLDNLMNPMFTPFPAPPVEDGSLNNLINSNTDWNAIDSLIQNYGINMNPYYT